MSRFPSDFLDEIRARVPISVVIGRRVRLVKSGRAFKGLCPFHTEKTPSFTVDDQRGRAHCFGCEWDGDVFKYACETTGQSFTEAVESLASEAGLPLPKRDPERIRQDARRLTLIQIVGEAEKWFSSRVSGAKPYLTERGLTDDDIARWGLGYSGDLKGFLVQTGISREDAIEAGLLKVGDDGRAYDVFRDRLIFPIRDMQGRTVGFTGRSLLPKEVQKERGIPKYLNSPETVTFSKGHLLYNGDRARQACWDGAPCIAVEGNMDTISLVKGGFTGTVAPMGTAMTEDQLRQLWRLSDSPVLCFDGDSAGQKAMYRTIDTVIPHLTSGRTVQFSTMPSGMDPDDVIRQKGPSGIERAVKAARSLADALWYKTAVGQRASTPDALAALETDLNGMLDKIPDQTLRRSYQLDMRDRLKALRTRPKVYRSNGHSYHSTSPGALRLMFGHSSRSGLSLKDATLIIALSANPNMAGDMAETVSMGGYSATAIEVVTRVASGDSVSEDLIEEAKGICGSAGLTGKKEERTWIG